jgi:predicted transglutaminase-like cysteine proteinase
MFRGICTLRRFRLNLLAPVLALGAVILCCNRAAAADWSISTASRLFGTVEYASGDLRMFRKWRHTFASSSEELSRCRADHCDERWRAIVDGARSRGLMDQLQEINRRINGKPYVADPKNWGSLDYWATPLEFLGKGGDCEDYAIAKYMALRHIGVPAHNMRIVVLKDLNASSDHAVLAVYVDRIPYILDNRTEAILSSISIAHYQPIYSINEQGWWLHRDARRPIITAQARKHVAPARIASGWENRNRSLAEDVGRGTEVVGSGRKVAVQLASFSRNEDADQAILEFRDRYHEVIAAEDLAVARVDLGDRGIWYRVLIGPFAARYTAIDVCGRIRKLHGSSDCFVTAMQ